MSSDYSLRCEKHQVDARDGEELLEHNGSTAYRAIRWAAEAGWLVTEAAKLTDGDMGDFRCWGRSVNAFLTFAHEHAECGGVTIMRDQGGGRQPDGKVQPLILHPRCTLAHQTWPQPVDDTPAPRFMTPEERKALGISEEAF